MSPPTNATPKITLLRVAPTVFLALLTGALAVMVGLQRAEIRRLSAPTLRPTLTVRQVDAHSVTWPMRRGATEAAAPTGRADGSEEAGGLLPIRREESAAQRSMGGLARLLDSPEFHQLLGLHRQAALDARFATLFRQLGLDTRELATFKRLLAEKENVALDVVAVSEARPEGPLSDTALLTSVNDAREQVEVAIRESLGHARYEQYREYERTLPQRAIVAQLEQRLSYSPVPLSNQQAESLVRILVAHAPIAARAEPVAAGVVLGKTAPAVTPLLPAETTGARITETAVAESQLVLAPAQVAALREIQGEQVATARAMQLLRDSLPPADRRIGAMLQALLQ